MKTSSLLALLVVLGCGSERAPQATETPEERASAGSMEARTASPEPEGEGQVEAEAAPSEAPAEDSVEAPAGAPSTESWAAVLSGYRKESGFDYAGLSADDTAKAQLASYVSAIGAASGVSDWSRDDQLTFFINAYNALTVSAVIERWPLDSVMNVDGFFDGITHDVAGEAITLNTLENERIRATFGEPRIHFAVNCASVSCPPLLAQPFAADTLEETLEAQAVAFVRSSTQIRGRRVTVSKLFEWFADDFGGADGVRTFVAERLEGDAAETVRGARLRYAEYDWNVNAAE
ncbi:MAG: DUF547 domain-containing protein [Myxococcota bacterium]